ncbi:hypothetical protein BT67DRAFT_442102 [Trichocladium antarcticum]|uniref:Aminoglycoside phosphotransferase domain-containing protein n=1 Tax=Trichocladium antarcticum TaxID=1450529 RepID=A0AAN6UK11_9PEZI|nr:hypothetical protein BT67DRAFT_442102 [Trichocladium antarcticum]
MQLMQERTSIPAPDVFGFCPTLDNPLRCPHIWLSFIPGISLYDFWFAKTHPDFDIQNLLVSREGDLVGIIDWDGVGAWPKSLGNLRYPGWLTRDWNPGMYGYGSDGVHDPEMREDSPQTLARYRNVYQDAIRHALGKHKMQGHSQAYHTSATPRS